MNYTIELRKINFPEKTPGKVNYALAIAVLNEQQTLEGFLDIANPRNALLPVHPLGIIEKAAYGEPKHVAFVFEAMKALMPESMETITLEEYKTQALLGVPNEASPAVFDSHTPSVKLDGGALLTKPATTHISDLVHRDTTTNPFINKTI